MKLTPGPDFAQIDGTMSRAAGSAASARATAGVGDTEPLSNPAMSAESRSRLNSFIGTPEIAPPDPGSLTYEPHFGLGEKPFSLSADPRFLYSHSTHGASSMLSPASGDAKASWR